MLALTGQAESQTWIDSIDLIARRISPLRGAGSVWDNRSAAIAVTRLWSELADVIRTRRRVPRAATRHDTGPGTR
jgi:hypothetical protein